MTLFFNIKPSNHIWSEKQTGNIELLEFLVTNKSGVDDSFKTYKPLDLFIVNSTTAVELFHSSLLSHLSIFQTSLCHRLHNTFRYDLCSTEIVCCCFKLMIYFLPCFEYFHLNLKKCQLSIFSLTSLPSRTERLTVESSVSEDLVVTVSWYTFTNLGEIHRTDGRPGFQYFNNSICISCRFFMIKRDYLVNSTCTN